MRPQFLNTENGSGKIVAESLNKIFKILENFSAAEIEYIDYKIIEIDDFIELERQLEMIDLELQEGTEWSID